MKRVSNICSSLSLGLLFLYSPRVALAQEPETIADILATVTQIVGLFTPFFLVLLYFFWNLAQLLFTLEDAEKKKQARARLLWSIVGMFVLFSLAGIVAVIQRTFLGGAGGSL